MSLYDIASGTTALIEARRLPGGVDVVMPVVGEALSPIERQYIARAIQDGIADDGDPPIPRLVSLFEPVDLYCEGHEVSPQDVAAVLRVAAAGLRWRRT